ncbi:MAG: DUF6434 domain-containing protein, partial [Burkholderiaceae bacterium]
MKTSPSAERPALDRKLNAEEFKAWYWLKEELLAFCRAHGIATSGSKPELAQRIAQFLAGGKADAAPIVRRVRGAMPAVYTPQARIGAGWTCSVALSQFFKQHCGKAFRFNAAMRDFIHYGEGKTLAQAIECYHASIAPDAPARPIAPQLEYNRFTRDYY